MTYFEEVFERIKRATSRRTQVALAEVLEIRQSSISDAKRRNSIPADWFMTLFEKFGLNPDWLKKGTGPMYLRTPSGGYSPSDPSEGSVVFEDAAAYGGADARGVIVTVYSSQTDGKAFDSKSIGRLSIPQSFYFEGLFVVRIDSSSMEPFIRKNAYVGIDTSEKHITSGELYAILFPYEGLVLRKVFIDVSQGVMRLRSDNPEHPETTLPLEHCEESIVGKVRFVLQRL